MNQPIKIRGWVIPDARMVLDHPQWITLWSAPPPWPVDKAIRHGLVRLETLRKRLHLGSHDGIARVVLTGPTGAMVWHAFAPGHNYSGAALEGIGASESFAPPPLATPPRFNVGDVITKIREEPHTAVLVERINAQGHDQGGAWVETTALYLPSSCSTEARHGGLFRYRLATEPDHELARAFAATFSAAAEPDQSGGGIPSKKVRGARSQHPKRSSSQTSTDTTRETQNGSERAQASHDAPSHSASSEPAIASASSMSAAVTAASASASESRKPSPKKRRVPRDHDN